jgi:hypothetical protein
MNWKPSTCGTEVRNDHIWSLVVQPRPPVVRRLCRGDTRSRRLDHLDDQRQRVAIVVNGKDMHLAKVSNRHLTAVDR